jgi:RNA polymerase sigma-70 factor, ECF subfamily
MQETHRVPTPSELGDAPSASRSASDDAELLALLQSDAFAGMQCIYDRYSALVYGLARTILGNTQEAEDLTQEVFLSLLKHCSYDPLRGTFAGYLTTMARSRSIDQLRFHKRTARVMTHAAEQADENGMQPDAPATPHETVALNECAASVRAALAQLPPIQRQVIELAYFKGMSQSEIAALLNTPLGTVKTWARKGLYGLRGALQKFVD